MAEPLSDSALDQLFRSARTYNGYLDTPVTETELRAIYELLKMGPTSANCQPLRITWCVTEESKAKLAALASATNAEKIRKAPVTAILAMDMEFYEKFPQLFPHADARSWFTGNAEMIATTAFRNSHCRPPISSWQRGHWDWIRGQCPASITRRWTRHFLREHHSNPT